MNLEEEEECTAAFWKETSAWSLRFANVGLESAYHSHKLQYKDTPTWFKRVLWSVVIMFVLRRMQLMIFAYYLPDTTTARYDVEIITICVLLCCFTFEIFSFSVQSLARVRGFAMLVAWFFTTSYTSQVYNPNKVVMTPT